MTDFDSITGLVGKTFEQLGNFAPRPIEILESSRRKEIQ